MNRMHETTRPHTWGWGLARQQLHVPLSLLLLLWHLMLLKLVVQ